VATFEPQELVSKKVETCAGLLAGSTKSALDGATGIGLPVAILVGPTRPRAVEDRLGDLLPGVTGHSHPDSHFGVEPRGIDPSGTGLFTLDVRGVPFVDGGERQGLWMRPHARRVIPGQILSLAPLTLGGDRLLKVGVGDLEAVLGGQFGAYAHELPIAVHRDRPPLLSAQLQGGQDALASPTVVDVDRLPVVGERGATRSCEVVVDPRAVKDGGEGANVMGGRFLERCAFDRCGAPFAVPPPICLIAVMPPQPFFMGRERTCLTAQRRPLQLLALSKRGLLLGLAGRSSRALVSGALESPVPCIACEPVRW
jgi:hypothetical protein